MARLLIDGDESDTRLLVKFKQHGGKQGYAFRLSDGRQGMQLRLPRSGGAPHAGTRGELPRTEAGAMAWLRPAADFVSGL